jgi:hypothetical protein
MQLAAGLLHQWTAVAAKPKFRPSPAQLVDEVGGVLIAARLANREENLHRVASLQGRGAANAAHDKLLLATPLRFASAGGGTVIRPLTSVKTAFTANVDPALRFAAGAIR